MGRGGGWASTESVCALMVTNQVLLGARLHYMKHRWRSRSLYIGGVQCRYTYSEPSNQIVVGGHSTCAGCLKGGRGRGWVSFKSTCTLTVTKCSLVLAHLARRSRLMRSSPGRAGMECWRGEMLLGAPSGNSRPSTPLDCQRVKWTFQIIHGALQSILCFEVIADVRKRVHCIVRV